MKIILHRNQENEDSCPGFRKTLLFNEQQQTVFILLFNTKSGILISWEPAFFDG